MQISSSKTRITPEGRFFPCYLLGHAMRTEKAMGVADDLWAVALVLKDEETMLIWVTLDLGLINKAESDRLKARLAKRYGVDSAAINIAVTHTHSGPEADPVSPFFGKEKGGIPGYMEWIGEQVEKAVAQCFEKGFEEVEAVASITSIEDCYGNRNGLDKPADKSVTTIEFRSGERVVAGILNFSCHPTVLGPQNRLVSADLAGYLARALQHRWGVYPLVMQGASGDMSNRLYRQGNDYAELKRIGDKIMAQLDANPKRILLKLQPIQMKTLRIEKTFVKDPRKNQELIAAIEEKIRQAKNFDEKKVYTSSLAVARAKSQETEVSFVLEGTYYKLGDLAVFAIPAELFSRFGMEIKQAMNVVCPMIWGYSNYSVGYLVDREDYGNSFESAAGDIPIGTTEEVTEEMIKIVRNAA